jgi:hypothetical protein
MADRFWEHCKYGSTQPARKYANASLTTYPELMSEAMIAKAGSINIGRGATITDFHGSEVAFWPDAEKIIAGAMQGGDPDVILKSTPNGAQGYFYDKCMEALSGAGIWKLHFYPWWWDDTYRVALDVGEQLTGYSLEEERLILAHKLAPEQIKWRRKKQKELGRLFIQEYPEDPISCFLTSGNSYFGDISGNYAAPLDAQWQEGHKYSAGLDFAQTTDFTCLIVLDRTTRTMVDYLHIHGLEWAEQRRRIKAMYNKWHLPNITAESNSIGGVNIEALRSDGVNCVPFETTNASKAEIASDLHDALHTDGLQLMDWPVLRHEMNTFVSTQLPSGIWRLAADGEGHDDTVMALMLAYHYVPIQVFL